MYYSTTHPRATTHLLLLCLLLFSGRSLATQGAGTSSLLLEEGERIVVYECLSGSLRAYKIKAEKQSAVRTRSYAYPSVVLGRRAVWCALYHTPRSTVVLV